MLVYYSVSSLLYYSSPHTTFVCFLSSEEDINWNTASSLLELESPVSLMGFEWVTPTLSLMYGCACYIYSAFSSQVAFVLSVVAHSGVSLPCALTWSVSYIRTCSHSLLYLISTLFDVNLVNIQITVLVITEVPWSMAPWIRLDFAIFFPGGGGGKSTK